MTRILVYEYCVAHGVGRDPDDPAHSLYREGRAMLDALTTDFWAVPDVEVVSVETESVEEFVACSAGCEWTVLIAPETSGELLQLAERVLAAGGRLLGPSPTGIALCTDKLQLGRHWLNHQVPTPTVFPLECARDCSFPAVLKLRDGAGSESVVRLDTIEDFLRQLDVTTPQITQILQPYVPGLAASAAFLIGTAEVIALPPTFQRLSEDGHFHYAGGELPIPPSLAARATTLARRAIDCVPGLFGYVGIDLVLGESTDGHNDQVIEINPRLTTSYVGLRAHARANLAAVWLNLARGEPCPELTWTPDRVEFRPDGTLVTECTKTRAIGQ